MVSHWKSMLLAVIFFLVYAFIGYNNFNEFGTPNNTQDFVFHYGQAKGIAWEDPYWQPFHDRGVPPNHNYPIIFHLIAQPFTSNELQFYLFGLVLIALVIPYLLLKIAKNDWVVAIYFFGVSFAQASIYSATYPQILVFIYILAYLIMKKDFQTWLFFMLLAVNTHSTGFEVFFLIGLAQVIDSIIKKIRVRLPTQLAGIVWLKEASIKTPPQLFLAFFSMIPPPMLYFGLKKETFSLILITTSVIVSLYDIRALSLAQILLVIQASKKIQTMQTSVQLGFLLYLTAMGLYYFLDFSLATQRILSS